MDDCANGCLIDSQSESNRSDQDTYFVRHPLFLRAPAFVRLHFAVVSDCRNPLALQEIYR